MDNIKLVCPVCSTVRNSRGEPFTSVRAVALHVAAKIKGNCSDHKIWAYENRGEDEIDIALAQAKAKDDINIHAKLLLVPVKKFNEDKGKPGIGFKK
ncbi:MAG: hypothetical protein JXA51_00355 [Dehalococcoidales bacterium]|nr:hypothetical protein [Dehalococcoidales bacterium]